MKAVIIQHLVKPTWSGRTITTETFICKGSEIVDRVNFYIMQRIHKENFIPVAKFEVRIFDHKGREVNSWEYIPTYR